MKAKLWREMNEKLLVVSLMGVLGGGGAGSTLKTFEEVFEIFHVRLPKLNH